MINIAHLSKSYRKVKAVSDLSLDINNGEIMGLAGLNGAGKSTTIRAASGIIFPTAGKITINNFDIVKEKVLASKQVGWVPELPNFEPDAKPISLLKYYAGFYGIKSDDAEKTGIELMKEFDIYNYRNRKLKYYSQGMKKRFSLIAAMIGNPDNYLFDETLNGLDPNGVKEVRDLILNLKKQGKSILLSSHILSELQNVADRIAIVKNGSVIKILTREDLMHLGTDGVKIHVKNADKNVDNILSQFGEPTFDGTYYYIKTKDELDSAEITGSL
jgi:ABC-type multidrug transport system, ATPase component